MTQQLSAEIGLLGLKLSAYHGASLGGFLFASACPIDGKGAEGGEGRRTACQEWGGEEERREEEGKGGKGLLAKGGDYDF